MWIQRHEHSALFCEGMYKYIIICIFNIHRMIYCISALYCIISYCRTMYKYVCIYKVYRAKRTIQDLLTYCKAKSGHLNFFKVGWLEPRYPKVPCQAHVKVSRSGSNNPKEVISNIDYILSKFSGFCDCPFMCIHPSSIIHPNPC